MSQKKKQFQDSIDLTLYNVVIQPVKLQSPERYEELFEKIKEEEISYSTYGDKATQIYSLKKWDGMLYGELINYTVLNSTDWYDSKKKTIEPYSVNPDMHPNPRKWSFFFIPDGHKFAVVSKASQSQVEKFFNYAFSKVVDEEREEEVRFHVIASESSIEKIFNLPDLTSLEIKLHYSNNDSDDDWDSAIDLTMKESDARSATLTVQGSQKSPLKIAGDSLIGGFLNLSRKNGTFKATYYNQKKRKVVSSSPVAEKKTILYQDEPSMLDSIKAFLRTLI